VNRLLHSFFALALLPAGAARALNSEASETATEALKSEPFSMIPEPQLFGLLAWTVAVLLFRSRLRR